MFTQRWRLLRVFGIPISLDLSWLIILALFTWTLTAEFSHTLPNYAPWVYWGMGLVTALGFFVCVLLHELGHAVVARSTGMPIRGITLFLFGGVAELGDEPRTAGGEFVMAIAGPVVSAFLAGICYLLAQTGADAGWPPLLNLCLSYLAWVNIAVLGFNLIPAFPLDGGRVFRSIVWAISGNLRRATFWASLFGQGFAWLLMAWALFNLFSGDLIQAIWLGLIGMFLNNAARMSYRQVVIREALQGEPVSRFMNREPIVVPPTLDLRHWVEDYVYRFHRKAFPVAADGHVSGYINTNALQRIPRDEWETHTVGEVMRHDLRPLAITPNTDTMEALGRMQRTGASRLLVLDGDQLVGIISLKDLLRFLHLKLELRDSGEDEEQQVHSDQR